MSTDLNCRLTEETIETLYLLGEQDPIVGISGYVVRPPRARREKPRVSAFTSANIDKIPRAEAGRAEDVIRERLRFARD